MSDTPDHPDPTRDRGMPSVVVLMGLVAAVAALSVLARVVAWVREVAR